MLLRKVDVLIYRCACCSHQPRPQGLLLDDFQNGGWLGFHAVTFTPGILKLLCLTLIVDIVLLREGNRKEVTLNLRQVIVTIQEEEIIRQSRFRVDHTMRPN